MSFYSTQRIPYTLKCFICFALELPVHVATFSGFCPTRTFIYVCM